MVNLVILVIGNKIAHAQIILNFIVYTIVLCCVGGVVVDGSVIV